MASKRQAREQPVNSSAFALPREALVLAGTAWAHLLVVRVRQEAAAFLQSSQDLLLRAVLLQVLVQIANQLLTHLTEATVLLLSHAYYARECRLSAGRAPPSPRGAGQPHPHGAHRSAPAVSGRCRGGAGCTPAPGSPPAGGSTGWPCRKCPPPPGTLQTRMWAILSIFYQKRELFLPETQEDRVGRWKAG